MVTARHAELAFHQLLEKWVVLFQQILAYLLGGTAPLKSEPLVQNINLDTLAVDAILLDERIHELDSMGFIPFAGRVQLTGLLQQVGGDVGDEAKGMGLLPRFHLAASKGMFLILAWSPASAKEGGIKSNYK